MKISEVVSLLRAGYTKKEIDELRNTEISSASAEISNSAIDLQPEEAPQPAAVAAAAAPTGPDNAEVLRAIQDLTKAIQAQNVRNDSFQPPKQDSAVDILGSLINKQP